MNSLLEISKLGYAVEIIAECDGVYKLMVRKCKDEYLWSMLVEASEEEINSGKILEALPKVSTVDKILAYKRINDLAEAGKLNKKNRTVMGEQVQYQVGAFINEMLRLVTSDSVFNTEAQFIHTLEYAFYRYYHRIFDGWVGMVQQELGDSIKESIVSISKKRGYFVGVE